MSERTFIEFIEDNLPSNEELYIDKKNESIEFDSSVNVKINGIEDCETIKEEEIEIFNDASQAIQNAAQAITEAKETVTKIKTVVNDFISVDGITDTLVVALQCCTDAATAVDGASTVWQQIQRQNCDLAATDNVKVKDELDESHDLKSDGYDAETLKPNLKLENDENGLQDSDFGDQLDDDQDYVPGENDMDPDDFQHEKVPSRKTKSYACEDCNYVGKQLKNLTAHRLKKHVEETEEGHFKCELCPYTSTNKNAYSRHISKVHMDKMFSCCLCKQLLLEKSLMEKHLKESHTEEIDHTCKKCRTAKKAAKRPQNYMQHIREVADMQECELCDFKTPSTKDRKIIRRHLIYWHFSPKEKCDLCDYVARNVGKLREHRQAVHEGRTYPCPWEGCTHQSKHKRNLKHHVEHVHKKVEVYCKKCPFKTRNPTALVQHNRSSHMEEKYYCDECTFIGASMLSLNSHISKTHTENNRNKAAAREDAFKNIEELVDENGVIKYKCRHCDYSTSNLSNLRDAHMPKHTGTVIKCDFCAFTTKNKRLLAVHVTNRHKEHKLICDQCDYSTNSKFHFNQHYQSKHEGVTYKCKWCDYSAITLQYLQKHQRRHEGKAYNCEFEGCSFVAPYPSDLTIHVNAVHKKVRLKCPECDYKAARKGDLNKHIKKVHGTDVQIIHCPKCRFVTSVDTELYEHIREAHDPDIAEPIVQEMKFQLSNVPKHEPGLSGVSVTHVLGNPLPGGAGLPGVSQSDHFQYIDVKNPSPI